MKNQASLLVALFAGSSLAFGQTQELYRIQKPAGAPPGWATHFVNVGDLDGDSVGDLVVGAFHHGGGTFGSVHSGANGALLYMLTAPIEALFYGAGLTAVADQNGDGVPELVAVGTRSGAHNSHEGRILVFSGADGSVWKDLQPPTGLNLAAQTPKSLLVLGDIDGDGGDDFLCRTSSTTSNGVGLTLFNSLTGAAIYHVTTPDQNTNIVDGSPHLSDHDGDGVRDFAIALFSPPDRFLQVISSATGNVIRQHNSPSLDGLTGNLEPFIDIEDRDRDGKRDIGTGGVFFGFVGISSSATGATLQTWDCETADVPCVGSRLIEVGDLNANGSRDLLTLNRPFLGSRGAGLHGLDPATGEVIFSEDIPGMDDGYSSLDRLVDLPGADPKGYPTFAIFEGINNYISVRRFVDPIVDPITPTSKP